ncbi:MAG: hypothetical protein L3J41_15755 [Melioribacteraceae bacterium]|nr:hypothetical protein [Melioribacteraceae bacterium]
MKLFYYSILLLAITLINSCTNPFAPKLDRALGSTGSIISSQKSIEGLFQNFLYSYTFKDTTIYGGLINSNYSFIYRDYDLSVDVSWGRDDDMRVTYGLFQNSQRLDLIWNNIVSMTEDSTNVIRSFNLTITFNPTDIIYVDGRVNLDLEKNDKGIWKIVNWIDESNF